jgi:hypothetical protein
LISAKKILVSQIPMVRFIKQHSIAIEQVDLLKFKSSFISDVKCMFELITLLKGLVKRVYLAEISAAYIIYC